MFVSLKIRPDPLDILWHHALGYMPDFLNGKNGRVGWVRWSHRGVQDLSKFKIPRKQKAYIMSPQFDIRFNVSFEEVLRECANTSRKVMATGFGETWLTEDLIQGMIKLNHMGYAHSYECWMGGRLVGGTFGIQLGGLVTMASLFHRVSNASKAAYSRSMMALRDRGFKVIDIGMVPKHHVDFGSDWQPRWQFESMLPEIIHQKVSLDDNTPCQPIPWQIRVGMPLVRAMRAAQRRMPGHAA